MVAGSTPLRVFVAMPGTSMGERAGWTNIPEIKRRLLEPVVEQLAGRVGRPPQLIIEKDKTSAGAIHRSMFAEALEADVYIADLTGANPNVYLELGVRWALRDRVTVPICQDLGEVKFNVSGVRVIPYGPMPDQLETAIDQMVHAATEGLQEPQKVDSPVRDSIPIIAVSRTEWERLRDEIERLKEQQADELIAAARTSPPARAVDLLRLAIERNPISAQAHMELGVALRKKGDYDEAVRHLQTAVQLKEDLPFGWRELGVALSKGGRLPEATAAFQRAVDLDPDDSETWSTLGGLRRRLARQTADGRFDWAMLREARDAYRHASQLRVNDTYPLVNEARLDLLLSAVKPDTRPAVVAQLRKLEHLARYAAEAADGRDPWKLFDLADTLLLTGRVDAGLAEVRSGIDLIDLASRKSYLTSVTEPWQDFLTAGVLDEQTATGVREAIKMCEDAIASVAPGRS